MAKKVAKTYNGDEILFKRGKWLIVKENTENLDFVWVVHKCGKRSDWDFDDWFRFDEVESFSPFYASEVQESCDLCGTKTPEPVQTIFKLLKANINEPPL